MTLTQFCEFFTEILEVEVFPVQFPFNSNREDCLTFDFTWGFSKGADIISVQAQFQARSSHPAKAEELLEGVIKKLHNLTNIKHDSGQVILINAVTPCPYFLGQDDNKNFLWTADFTILLSRS